MKVIIEYETDDTVWNIQNFGIVFGGWKMLDYSLIRFEDGVIELYRDDSDISIDISKVAHLTIDCGLYIRKMELYFRNKCEIYTFNYKGELISSLCFDE